MSSSGSGINKMSEDDLRRYRQTRQQQYPTTYQNTHPSRKAQADYEEYSARTRESNASVETYWQEYNRHAGGRRVPIDTLSEQQHRQLVNPAAEAATDTHM